MDWMHICTSTKLRCCVFCDFDVVLRLELRFYLGFTFNVDYQGEILILIGIQL